MAKHPRFETFTGKNGKHYFRLTAKNGEAILSSQGYASKSGCKNGIASVKKNAGDAARFEKKENKGKYWFNLLAANKKVIGTSQMYKTNASRNAGIKSVGTNAGKAEIEAV